MIRDFSWGFIQQNRGTLLLYCTLILILATQRVVVPHIYGKVIATLHDGVSDSSKALFFSLIGIWVLYQLVDVANNYVESVFLPKLQNESRQHMFSVILKAYSENYRELDLGDITSKIIKFPEAVRDMFLKSKSFVFVHFFGLLISLIYMSVLSWKLGVVVAVSYLVIIGLCLVFLTKCSPIALDRERIFDQTQEEIQDTLFNLLSIYTTDNEHEEVGRIRAFNKKSEDAQRYSIRCVNWYRSLYTFFFILVFISYNATAYYLFITKELSAASLTSIFILTFVLLGGMMNFMNDTNSFLYSWTKLKSVLEYTDQLKRKKSNPKDWLVIPNPSQLQIEFMHVTYGAVLRDISLTISHTDHVAIVGNIGVGKSTLAQLLCRLRPASSGDILINGISIYRMPLRQVRSLICYIPQNPKLFNRTLLENMRYGLRKQVTEKDIYDLLKQFEFDDLVRLFRERMNSPAGKSGSFLSGGQRQVIWVLKAILGDYPVIVMDEPTSSLDAHSRHQILRLTKFMARDKILIIITHDPDVMQYMNRVVRIDKGKVVVG